MTGNMGGDVWGMIGGGHKKHNNPPCLMHIKPVLDTEFDDATIIGMERVGGENKLRQNRSRIVGCFAFYSRREQFLS